MINDVGMRASTSYKRRVSFSHSRQRSGPTQYSLAIPQGHRRTASAAETISRPRSREEQTPSLLNESFSTEELTPKASADPSGTARRPVPDLDIRKPRVSSSYWKEEARNVSYELEKICEEAFNRSSVSSGSDRHIHVIDSPATTVSMSDMANSRRTSTGLTAKDPASNRTLPNPPLDTLGNLTLHELGETRRRLLEHCQMSGAREVPSYLVDVIKHLDQLIQGEGDKIEAADRRSASDPIGSTGSRARHQVGQDHNSNTKDGSRRNYDNYSYRAASDPLRTKTGTSRNEKKTIRIVEPEALPSIEAPPPLSIRKKPIAPDSPLLASFTDQMSGAQPVLQDKSYPPSDPRYQNALDTIEENPRSPRRRGMIASPTGARKWSWFNKRQQEGSAGEFPPTPPRKDTMSQFSALEQSQSQNSNGSKAQLSPITETHRSNAPVIIQGGPEEKYLEPRQQEHRVPSSKSGKKWYNKVFGKGKDKMEEHQISKLINLCLDCKY